MSIPLSSSKDLDVQLKDFNGKEISVNDINLELHLSPQQLMASTLRQNDNVKCRVKQMLSRLTKPNCQKTCCSKSTTTSITKGEESVMYIKKQIILKDSINGNEFDVEMDLKVEIEEDPDQIRRLEDIPRNDRDENQERRRRSLSCGRGVKEALKGRLCRPLFGGSTSRLDHYSHSVGNKENVNSNNYICAASCISAPWKRRLRRRKSKQQHTKKEVLARSKSLDLPRQRELESFKGL